MNLMCRVGTVDLRSEFFFVLKVVQKFFFQSVFSLFGSNVIGEGGKVADLFQKWIIHGASSGPLVPVTLF